MSRKHNSSSFNINNNFAISTDFIGANWDYPEADYATRAKIWQAHEDWQKGLNLRNTDENHRRIHPNDRFFRYQNQMADRSIYWGSKKDAPSFNYED